MIGMLEDEKSVGDKNSVRGFRYLEHTADVYYEAYGYTFKDAFNNAILALLNTVTGGKGGKERPNNIIHEFTNCAIDLEELVVYTLSDILSYMDSNEIVFYDSDVVYYKTKEESKDHKYHIKAILYGNNDRPKESVKAVTFHMLKIYKDNDKVWHIKVLLDV